MTENSKQAVLTPAAAPHVTWPAHRWVSRHRGQLPSGIPARDRPDVSPPILGIRRRRAKDLGACARLLRVVYSQGQYPVYWPEAPRAWLSGQDVVTAWVLERHGEIIGHVAISRVGLDPVSALRWRELTGQPPSALAGVSRFFVRPRVRGQGFGTALLDVAVANIRAAGLAPVFDVVSASKDAIKLHEDRGWQLRGTYPWGKPTDKLQISYYTSPPESDGY